tara:strand:+ start:357 stop:617 length:261 start_codon:yes stop_codon:yes gene_type:complete
MKVIGKNILIKKAKQGVAKTKGGLLLTENTREDLRYNKALVYKIGNEVVGIKEKDSIFYDKHAGHEIEIKKELYQIIKLQDVVVVL